MNELKVLALIYRSHIDQAPKYLRDLIRLPSSAISLRNRKLWISRAPTKAKSQEPAYSQALNQNKIDRQRLRSRESGRQTVRRLWWMVFGVETGRKVRGRQ